MKAGRIFGAYDLRIVDVPKPSPQPQEVLCRVVRAGICGTDYAIYTGEFSFVKKGMVPFPMTPGHEWSGVVTEIGSDVTNFKVGDRVVGDTAVSCGKCQECLVGQYLHCKNLRCVGTINTWDGAYAEYIIMPERHLFHLPDSVSFDNGAMVEPAATALYSVVLGEVKIGDTVLVLGSGPIGIIAAKLAKLCGASKVGIAARKDFKLQKALDLGVDVTINTTNISLAEGVRQSFGEWGVDKIIEASGSTELFKESLNLVNPGGVISVVAFYEKMVDNFDIDKFVFGDIKIRAVAGSLGMYKPILRLMATGMLDLSSIITSRHTLSEVPEVLKNMVSTNSMRIKQMIEYK
ncbi:MAG: alcohol dehydrogenase catalytic domain-containing protein [Phycisphaerae bacterium]|jgi:2-desacetyl-2-hydroxyethyl bacteriochlorophyllide A dehydrogenase